MNPPENRQQRNNTKQPYTGTHAQENYNQGPLDMNVKTEWYIGREQDHDNNVCVCVCVRERERERERGVLLTDML